MRVLVVGVGVDLLLEGVGRLLILIVSQVGAAKIVPQTLVLGISLRHALEQFDGQGEVVVVRGLRCRVEQVVGRLSGAQSGRAGRFVVEVDALRLVSFHRAAERRIVLAALERNFGHQDLHLASGREVARRRTCSWSGIRHSRA